MPTCAKGARISRLPGQIVETLDMPNKLQNHRVWLNGRETDLTLEAGFWAALGQIARKQRRSVECLLCELDDVRPRRGLRSAVIEFVLSNA